jgi:SAM-dependent methyltransferase
VPDPAGQRYAQYWEPILRGPGRRLLDRVASRSEAAAALERGASRGVADPHLVLDVGAGTGALALAAAARWPRARVIAVDASPAMLSVARHRQAADAPASTTNAPEWLVADAAALPLADESVDVALSAFMLQLVPARGAVLAELHRVLRAGGSLGLATWLADDRLMAADVEFDEAVYDLGIEDPEPAGEEPSGDLATPDELRDELEAAGLVTVETQVEELVHAWSPAAYLDFKERYDEWDLFSSLAPHDRSRLRERVRARWRHLPEAAFTLRAPIVRATARRTPSRS